MQLKQTGCSVGKKSTMKEKNVKKEGNTLQFATFLDFLTLCRL